MTDLATATTIPSLVTLRARELTTQEAIVDGDIRLSFVDVDQRMREAAAAMIAAGVQQGDRVALWAPNSAAWITAALGIMAAGGVLVPINSRYRGDEAADIIERSSARLVITSGAFAGLDYAAMLEQSRPELGVPVILLGGNSAARRTVPWAQFLDAGGAPPMDAVDTRIAASSSDGPAYVLYTSGTTGLPKGAVLSHAGNLWCVENLRQSWAVARGDRIYAILPFCHIFGLNGGFLIATYAGATSVIATHFDIDQTLRTLEDERITCLPGPPTIFQALLEHPRRDQFDLSALRAAFLASAVLPESLLRAIVDEGLATTVAAGYGLTEGGPVVLSRPGDDPSITATTAGVVGRGVELKIVDGTGADVPLGEPGEILVRSPMNMLGYLDDPEQTAAAFDADGFLRTGDVGVLDAEGYLRVTDRKKDVFLVGGFSAFPAEIERILATHPAVGQVAVVGAPDDRLGEVGVAFVVPTKGQTLEPDDVIAFARGSMANYKVPRQVVVVSELPLTTSLKVQKNVLRERARDLTAHPTTDHRTPAP